jgi:hypothetical protein
MLSRSVRSEQENFASDTATVAKDPTGHATKVSFAGKMAKSLSGWSMKTATSAGQSIDRFPPNFGHSS